MTLSDKEKKICAVLMVAVVIGACILAILPKGNQSDPTPEIPGKVYYKFTSIEVFDTFWGEQTKTRDYILNQFNDTGERPGWNSRYFSPFDENDYKWVKVTLKYDAYNIEFDITANPEYPYYVSTENTETGVTGHVKYYPTVFKCLHLEGYFPKGKVYHDEGTVGLWFLLPQRASPNQTSATPIPWETVAPSEIGIDVYAKSPGEVILIA